MVFGGTRITGGHTVSRNDLATGAASVANKITQGLAAEQALATLETAAGKLLNGKRLAIYDRSNAKAASPRFARQHVISQQRAEHTVAVTRTLFAKSATLLQNPNLRQELQDQLDTYLSAKDSRIEGGELLRLVRSLRAGVTAQAAAAAPAPLAPANGVCDAPQVEPQVAAEHGQAAPTLERPALAPRPHSMRLPERGALDAGLALAQDAQAHPGALAAPHERLSHLWASPPQTELQLDPPRSSSGSALDGLREGHPPSHWQAQASRLSSASTGWAAPMDEPGEQDWSAQLTDPEQAQEMALFLAKEQDGDTLPWHDEDDDDHRALPPHAQFEWQAAERFSEAGSVGHMSHMSQMSNQSQMAPALAPHEPLAESSPLSQDCLEFVDVVAQHHEQVLDMAERLGRTDSPTLTRIMDGRPLNGGLHKLRMQIEQRQTIVEHFDGRQQDQQELEQLQQRLQPALQGLASQAQAFRQMEQDQTRGLETFSAEFANDPDYLAFCLHVAQELGEVASDLEQLLQAAQTDLPSEQLQRQRQDKYVSELSSELLPASLALGDQMDMFKATDLLALQERHAQIARSAQGQSAPQRLAARQQQRPLNQALAERRAQLQAWQAKLSPLTSQWQALSAQAESTFGKTHPVALRVQGMGQAQLQALRQHSAQVGSQLQSIHAQRRFVIGAAPLAEAAMAPGNDTVQRLIVQGLGGSGGSRRENFLKQADQLSLLDQQLDPLLSHAAPHPAQKQALLRLLSPGGDWRLRVDQSYQGLVQELQAEHEDMLEHAQAQHEQFLNAWRLQRSDQQARVQSLKSELKNRYSRMQDVRAERSELVKLQRQLSRHLELTEAAQAPGADSALRALQAHTQSLPTELQDILAQGQAQQLLDSSNTRDLGCEAELHELIEGGEGLPAPLDQPDPAQPLADLHAPLALRQTRLQDIEELLTQAEQLASAHGQQRPDGLELAATRVRLQQEMQQMNSLHQGLLARMDAMSELAQGL